MMAISIRVPSLNDNPIEWQETRQQAGQSVQMRLSMCALATIWILGLITQKTMPMEYIFYITVVAVMIIYRFRENIQRLASGTERRLGDPA